MSVDYSQRLRKKDWSVEQSDLSTARDLVSRYHYARGGSNTGVHFHALFRVGDATPKGIAWWLPPTRVCAESVNKTDWKRVLSLTRLVVIPGVEKNAASFLIARSIKRIRAEKKWKSLVTFADDSEGHTGRIYRATNWTYIGKTGPYHKWIDPTSGRQVAKKATKNRKAAEMRALGYEQIGPFFKHKFVIHL